MDHVMTQQLSNLCHYEQERDRHWAHTWSTAWISNETSATLKRKHNSQRCFFLTLRVVSEGGRIDPIAEGLSREVCYVSLVLLWLVLCPWLLPSALLQAVKLCWAGLAVSLKLPLSSSLCLPTMCASCELCGASRAPPKSTPVPLCRAWLLWAMRGHQCHVCGTVKDRWFVHSCRDCC